MSTSPTAYRTAVADLQAQFANLPAGAPVRLGKRTSNLFRSRVDSSAPRLDVSRFAGVMSVDREARTADVLGMTTYEQLVDATLPHGLMPLVVPQLKTITLGGAVTGLGIESSSFRNGMPHESVVEMDVLTGDSRVVTCSRTVEPELFFGFPNSYGTLGYALRLRIELEPVEPYVALRHVRCDSIEAAGEVMREACTTREHDGARVDFVDGTWFSPGEVYVTLAAFTGEETARSDYTGQSIYYRSVQRLQRDWLTTRDYLWRWDTDWFWCSRALGVQNPKVRRWVPRRYMRSDTWWKLVNLEKRYRVKTRIDRWRGLPEREEVVQDIEVPLDRLPDFMEFFAREVPIEPVWLCPIQQRDASATWQLYALEPETLYVNVGFWSTVPLAPGQHPDAHNRRVEQVVGELGGRKSLYSTSFYEPAEFWSLYGGTTSAQLKAAYDPDGRLLDLYEKCVGRR